jgi:hypothetical protein
MRLSTYSPFSKRALYPLYQRAFQTRKMNTAAANEVLYALTVGNAPNRPGPQDALEKSHHAKTGFRNPWE